MLNGDSGPSCQFDSLETSIFPLCMLPDIGKAKFKSNKLTSLQSLYDIIHKQMGRNMMIPWIIELSAFLSPDDIAKINMFVSEEVLRWIRCED